jgi:hypothetical protein
MVYGKYNESGETISETSAVQSTTAQLYTHIQIRLFMKY